MILNSGSRSWREPLPPRLGDRPLTTRSAPHEQLDQIAPPELQREVARHALGLPGVSAGLSTVSVPGTHAFLLDPRFVADGTPGPLGDEWGHLHPPYDGSLHVIVPETRSDAIIASGWGEHHYLVEVGVLPPSVVMIHGPRDTTDLDTVLRIVDLAYSYARWGDSD